MMVTFGEGIRPEVNNDGVPLCSDSCPSFDGKRCERMGFRPQRICEPAVIEIVSALTEAVRQQTP